MENKLIVGSIGAIAQQSGQSLAESFISADVILLIDVSGSMRSCDGNDNLSRHERACTELATLQNTLPGRVAVVSFSDHAGFCPSGIPTEPSGTTKLAGALQFVKVADLPSGMKFVIISDGAPEEPEECLRIARTFKNHISVIYIGPEGGSGQAFLEKLAKVTGGQQVTASGALLLSSTVQALLLKA